MHCIYNYVPKTNRVYRVFNVATVLYLQLLLHVMLFNVATVQYLQFLLHVMLFTVATVQYLQFLLHVMLQLFSIYSFCYT
jgi:hypothetical protein